MGLQELFPNVYIPYVCVSVWCFYVLSCSVRMIVLMLYLCLPLSVILSDLIEPQLRQCVQQQLCLSLLHTMIAWPLVNTISHELDTRSLINQKLKRKVSFFLFLPLGIHTDNLHAAPIKCSSCLNKKQQLNGDLHFVIASIIRHVLIFPIIFLFCFWLGPPWTSWSSCSTRCGPGTRTRMRCTEQTQYCNNGVCEYEILEFMWYS